MSEFMRPQPEQPWEETERTLHTFKNGMDDRFRDHFEDVDRGILSHGLLPERLRLKTEGGTLFTLVRTIDLDPDAPNESTFYGLHIKENVNDYFYRIKFGVVHKLSPTPGEVRCLNLNIQNYTAGMYPKELTDQLATFQDVERVLKLAKKATPPPLTFQDILNIHMNTYMETIKNEITGEIYDEYDFPVDYDKEHEAEREAATAVPFFNWSIDEIMDAHAEDVKKVNTTEVLQKIKRGDGENEALAITLAREKCGDVFDDQRVVIVHQYNNYSIEMVFQINGGVLQSSQKIDHPSIESGTTHVLMDPNSARDLIKFIRNPKL